MHDNILRCHGLLLGTIDKILTINDSDLNCSKSDQVRNLASFPATADKAHDTTTSADASPQAQLQRFKALYSTLNPNKNIQYSETLDKNTFIDLCTKASSHETPLDDDMASKVLTMAPYAAIFSLRLARLSASATDQNIPSGPVFGLCYPFCQEGDTIAAFYGCSEIAVLRPDPSEPDKFKVMCQAYVNGVMDGEGVGVFSEREFELT